MKKLVFFHELGDLPRKIPWWKQIFGYPWHKYLDSIKRQIQERGDVPDEVWGDPQRLAIARQIEAIIADACWGECFKFHPDDPYVVVGEWEAGDLSELECLMEIEDQFGIHFADDEMQPHFERNITFGEFVDLVIQKSEKAQPT